MRSSSYLVLAFRIKLEQIKYKNNNQTARKYQRNVTGISLLIRTVIPEPMVIHIPVNVDSVTGFAAVAISRQIVQAIYTRRKKYNRR